MKFRKTDVKHNALFLLIISSLLFLCGFVFMPQNKTYSELKWTDIITQTDRQAFENLGNGTLEEPYLITNAKQLATLSKLVSMNAMSTVNGKYFSTQNYKLTDDITLYSTQNPYEWNPIGTTMYPFVGTFDGGGNTILDLKISVDSKLSYAGLFGYTNGATIKNLSITSYDSSISANSSFSKTYAGGFVAYAQNSTFDNLSNLGIPVYAFSNDTAYAGGIVGYSSSCNFNTVSNLVEVLAYVTSSIIHKKEIISYSGGIVGKAEGSQTTITYARNNGTIKSFSDGLSSIIYAGGIIGQSNVIISTSFNSGEVICGGESSFTLKGVTYTNNLPSSSYAGGIAGKSDNTISYVYNTGKVSSLAKPRTVRTQTRGLGVSFSGEIDNRQFGFLNGESKRMYLSAGVRFHEIEYDGVDYNTSYYDEQFVDAYAGGIAGYANHSIGNAYNDGKISGGGIIMIDNFCFTTGIKMEYRSLLSNADYRKWHETYVTISYYTKVYFSAINGNNDKVSLATFGKIQGNYFKEMKGVSRYKSSSRNLNDPIMVGDPQPNADYGRVDYSKTNSTSTSLVFTPLQNTTTDNFYDNGEETYMNSLQFMLSTKRSGSNIISSFYWDFTIYRRFTKNRDGWYTDAYRSPEARHELIAENTHTLNYTVKNATSLTVSDLGGSGYWAKSLSVNSNRPYIKNFYW